MSKQWYAAYRPYGIMTLNRDGPRADRLLVFDQKAARDVWVALDPQRREAIAATDPEIRTVRRFEERLGYRVVSTLAQFAAGE